MNLPFQLEELRDRKVWVNFVMIPKGERMTKPPVNPNTLRDGSSTDSSRWSDFETANQNIGKEATIYVDGQNITATVKGVGIVLAGSGITGIDLDHVVRDGKILPEAQQLILSIGSYAEMSPSGDGVHILTYGKMPEKPEGARNWNKIKNDDGSEYEMYCDGRYFTVTGKAFREFKKIENRERTLADVHRKYFEKLPDQPTSFFSVVTEYIPPEDHRLIWEKMFSSQNGSEIRSLYNGDISGFQNDHSRADLALMNHIGYAVNYDPAEMESLFNESALASRDKWQKRSDYRKRTIDLVLRDAQIRTVTTAREDFSEPKKTMTTVVNGVITPLEEKKPTFREYDVRSYLSDDIFGTDIEYFKKYKDRKIGFENLDKYLTLYPGVACLGGASSLGKTTFAVNIVDNLLQKGESVIYFALEQLPIEIVTKSLARKVYEIDSFSPITNIDIKNGASSDALIRAKKDFAEIAENYRIVKGDFHVTAKDIANYVEEYIKETGKKPIVIIDYLQLIASPEGFRGTQREITDENLKTIKDMQIRNELFVLLISSFNRASYKEPVSMESFKESGMIEYTCDYILGLQLSILEDSSFYTSTGSRGGERENNNDKKEKKLFEAINQNPKEVELVGLKNRNGKQRFKCFFKYRMDFDSFTPDMNCKYEPESASGQFRAISDDDDISFKTV